MAWEDTLQTFKEQFQAAGPEKYAGIADPSLRYELAGQRSQGALKGANMAVGVIADNRAKEIDYSERKAAAARADAERKKQQGYTRQYNENGGYTFLSPDGKPVSALEYAMANQKPVSWALQGSYDPKDQEYLQMANAMAVDLQAGRFKMPEAMEMLAKDFPNIYGNFGAEAGNNYSSRSRAQGEPEVESRITGLTAKRDKQLADTLRKIQSTQDFNQAEQIANQYLGSDSLTKMGFESDEYKRHQQAVDDTLYNLYRTKILSNGENEINYPF